jgi:hypothetical protein
MTFQQENKELSNNDKNDIFQDYSINDWPLNASNKSYLNAMKSLHSICPIPPYDIRGHLISPLDYEEKLTGSIAHVCFSIVHFVIRQKHIYNAILHDITVM